MPGLLVSELMLVVSQPALVMASSHPSRRPEGQRLMTFRPSPVANTADYLRVPIDYFERGGNYVLGAHPFEKVQRL